MFFVLDIILLVNYYFFSSFFLFESKLKIRVCSLHFVLTIFSLTLTFLFNFSCSYIKILNNVRKLYLASMLLLLILFIKCKHLKYFSHKNKFLKLK